MTLPLNKQMAVITGAESAQESASPWHERVPEARIPSNTEPQR